MMERAEKLSQAELEIENVVKSLHKGGLGYWDILGIFIRMCEHLFIKSGAEYILKGGK